MRAQTESGVARAGRGGREAGQVGDGVVMRLGVGRVAPDRRVHSSVGKSTETVGGSNLIECVGAGYGSRAARLDGYCHEWQAAADAQPEPSMLEAQTLRTLYRVSDFVGWQREGTLELNPNFQRRSVWKKGAKSFLIDTILRGYPVPIIFLRDKKTDLKTLKSKRDVVDGQQRIRTLLSFIDHSLLPDYDEQRDDFEINKTHNRELGGKRFHQLSMENRQRILDYQFSVHSFPTDTDDRMILQIFARMNATGVKLNSQELRNAEFFGEFKTSAYELATEQLYRWRDDWEVFNPDGIARMMEVEMASEFMMYIMTGVLEKKSATIDSFYKQFDATFADRQEVERRFRTVFDTIDDLLRNGIHRFFSSRTMFFALFSAVYGIQFEGRPSSPGRLKLSDIGRLSKDRPAPLTPEMTGRLIRNATAIKNRQAPEAVLKARQSGTTDATNRRALINYLVA
ncbi:MAG: DUF262 domain-containing protein [Bradyrhizobium sp.]|uniref:DUF262 domain-containing protein n=1 Tax=Bradyrhizobium sp. TaxID=376 RepID=UPI001A26D6EC|nr:DUF262 domain-containing protein [Bradyrhizobium sp.]MBJ7405938.1 DUF262 domain-containing protein [Bradyrhizobium sp.]